MSHGRDPATMSPAQWNDRYTSGVPHWDPGRPQPAFLDLVTTGAVRGRVLDAGCGSGEHVLLCAAHGLDATGIDLAPAAIRLAERKAAERGLTARFLVHDAYRLAELGETFDTVLDSGLLHIFTDSDRDAYLRSVRSVLVPGGRMFVLCFGDQQNAAGGPRRLSRDELTAAFAHGWHIDAITPTMLDTAGGAGIPGWLVRLTRQGPISAHARVPTARAIRYLDQFCQHAQRVQRISHRPHHHTADPHSDADIDRQVTVRRDGNKATLDFGRARCTLDAQPDALTLRVEADDAEALHRIQTLLTADLARFGYRERLTVTWPRGKL
jgi:SAM-dependent methyltransferase